MNESHYDNCALRIRVAFSPLESSCEAAILNDFSWQGTYGSYLFYTIRKATLLEVVFNTPHNNPPVDWRLVQEVFHD